MSFYEHTTAWLYPLDILLDVNVSINLDSWSFFYIKILVILSTQLFYKLKHYKQCFDVCKRVFLASNSQIKNIQVCTVTNKKIVHVYVSIN